MKYVPGLLVGQLSGKAGNTVASRNTFGSYLRTRTIPMLVQNALTTAVRNNLGSLATQYRTLTQAQRQGWIALGGQISRQDSLGITYYLTGIQAYVAINRNLFTLGGAAVADAPAYTPPIGLLTITLTATSV